MSTTTETKHDKPQDTAEKRPELTQVELERRYLEQQRRLACPGCGEKPFLS